MKKITAIFLAMLAFTAVLMFSGCSDASKKDDGRLDIVCTTFPQYDWVKNIVKGAENVNVTLLCSNGSDIHGYVPTVDDIITVDSCDVLIYIGTDAEKGLLDGISDSNSVTVINLLELVRKHSESGSHLEHVHTEECSHGHDHNSHTADEHVWLSLKNAKLFCEEITEILCKKDEANSGLYKANCESYTEKLSALDTDYAQTVSSSSKNVMVVADRFPFVYLAEDYGIECFAAFPGCSSEINATFGTVIELAEKVDKYELSYIVTTENTTGKTAEAVTECTKSKKAKTVILDSMQSVSEKDIKNGVTYLSVMEDNLDALAKILEVQ